MLKDINLHFSSNKTLPLSPRTQQERFQTDPRGSAVPGGYAVRMLTGDSHPRGQCKVLSPPVATLATPVAFSQDAQMMATLGGEVPVPAMPRVGCEEPAGATTSQPPALGNTRNGQGLLGDPLGCCQSPTGFPGPAPRSASHKRWQTPKRRVMLDKSKTSLLNTDISHTPCNILPFQASPLPLHAQKHPTPT